MAWSRYGRAMAPSPWLFWLNSARRASTRRCSAALVASRLAIGPSLASARSTSTDGAEVISSAGGVSAASEA